MVKLWSPKPSDAGSNPVPPVCLIYLGGLIMSKPVKIWGYDEFPSKTAAISYLLNEGVSVKDIRRKINCSYQLICLARKSLQKQKENAE